MKPAFAWWQKNRFDVAAFGCAIGFIAPGMLGATALIAGPGTGQRVLGAILIASNAFAYWAAKTVVWEVYRLRATIAKLERLNSELDFALGVAIGDEKRAGEA